VFNNNRIFPDLYCPVGRVSEASPDRRLLEHDNSNTRHHLGRFTRRTKVVVSRKREMVELTLRIWHAITTTDLFESLQNIALSIYR
ncbi:MAG: hypothetical protein LBS89_08840, partial [Zoogloeaceae bacterium]|nr:hypothetical protein [Zoogloeaceae bacterium]